MLKHISIVDDDAKITQFISTLVHKWGYETNQYTDVWSFLKKEHDPQDVILLDLCMPVLDGVEVIRKLAENRCQAGLILMTGQDERILKSAQSLCKEYQLHCLGGVAKPIKIPRLKTLLSGFSQFLPASVELQAPSWSPTKQDLKQALENDELLLHFQPQVDIKSGLVNRVEALVRWDHPVHGLIYPDSFIALAEQEKLIDQLSEKVIQMAIWEGQQWWQKGKNIEISVNISAHNICNFNFTENLINYFQDHDISSSLISLEITESQLMEKWSASLDSLTRLRMKGFALSIDDFGTGYSSFAHLHKIPFSEIKIDKSFVMNMTKDSTANAIVESCIMLSHKLNMTCVAEGVESQQHLCLLASMGCDMAQGYYYARPMPGNELNSWLNLHSRKAHYG